MPWKLKSLQLTVAKCTCCQVCSTNKQLFMCLVLAAFKWGIQFLKALSLQILHLWAAWFPAMVHADDLMLSEAEQSDLHWQDVVVGSLSITWSRLSALMLKVTGVVKQQKEILAFFISFNCIYLARALLYTPFCCRRVLVVALLSMTGQIIKNTSRSLNALLKKEMTAPSDVKVNRNCVSFVIACEIGGHWKILFGFFFFFQ